MRIDKLKEMTKSEHKRAENTAFIRKMIKKELPTEKYVQYLFNQHSMYKSLEDAIDKLGWFDEMKLNSIKRNQRILKDYLELTNSNSIILSSTEKYNTRIAEISNDKEALISHLYVRHMGDLSGGQIIKRFTPGSGSYYEFTEDVNALKEKLIRHLNDNMATEAKLCFELIIDFLEELNAT
jgi:heme oxygenase (biliverdin-producing, ferredoxin)